MPRAVLYAIENEMVRTVHDCSKGGLAVAVSEMCFGDSIGCRVYSNLIPADKMPMDRLLFSDGGHSRYLLVPRSDLKRILEYLEKRNEFCNRRIWWQVSFDRDKKRIGPAVKLRHKKHGRMGW